MPDVRSPTVRRRELGALLRKLRTEKGLTVEQAAEQLMFSMSKLSRMETGHGVATPRDIRDLCDLYDVTDEAERERMTTLAREGKQQGWWQAYDLPYSTYVGLEAEAVSIKDLRFGGCSRPFADRGIRDGLCMRLRCPSMTTTSSVSGSRCAPLGSGYSPGLTRPACIWYWTKPCCTESWGVPRSCGLSWPGSSRPWSLPNVTIQVIPYASGAHPALDSVFTLLEFAPPAPDVIYVEGLVGYLYLEQARDIRRYRDVFDRLSVMALNQRKSGELLRKVIMEHKRLTWQARANPRDDRLLSGIRVVADRPDPGQQKSPDSGRSYRTTEFRLVRSL